jgi:hypothetical protein
MNKGIQLYMDCKPVETALTSFPGEHAFLTEDHKTLLSWTPEEVEAALIQPSDHVSTKQWNMVRSNGKLFTKSCVLRRAVDYLASHERLESVTTIHTCALWHLALCLLYGTEAETQAATLCMTAIGAERLLTASPAFDATSENIVFSLWKVNAAGSNAGFCKNVCTLLGNLTPEQVRQLGVQFYT